MIILIAESKTMRTDEEDVSPEYYKLHTPSGEREASEIMERIAGLDVAGIVEATKMSPSMASRLMRMAYEFPNKHAGLQAIEAYTGVVFKNFDYSSLSSGGKTRTDNQVRIISSLYGWLNPSDIIKPYRLDFTSPLSPDDSTLWRFWRGRVTAELMEVLREREEREILNLLPADAAKLIDWSIVRKSAGICTVDFKEITGTTIRTPHAGRLKALRGKLLREIIEEGIHALRQLSTFTDPDFLPPGYHPSEDKIVIPV